MATQKNYCSSSRASPILCPPALKFFPSIKVERVRVIPRVSMATINFSFHGDN